MESADLTGARDELVEALQRVERIGAHRPEGVHTVERLQPGAGRARPRGRLPALGPAGSRRFPVVPVGWDGARRLRSSGVGRMVWPRLGHGGEGEITFFGHVARFEGLEELNAGLDKEASRHATRSSIQRSDCSRSAE